MLLFIVCVIAFALIMYFIAAILEGIAVTVAVIIMLCYWVIGLFKKPSP